MGAVAGEFLEEESRGPQVTLEDGEVFGFQGSGLEFTQTATIAPKITAEGNIRAKSKGLGFREGAAEQPENCQKAMTIRVGRSFALPFGKWSWMVVDVVETYVPDMRRGHQFGGVQGPSVPRKVQYLQAHVVEPVTQ
jgi:hypothetical protein